MKELSVAQLKAIAPYAKMENITSYVPLLNRYMNQYKINTYKRQSAFLAQIIYESGSFNYTKEIASGKKYEGRKDLGNIKIGDGVKYKGRGLLQITGRFNYTQVSKALKIDFVSSPELLELPIYAVWSACWWWQEHHLNTFADAGDFVRITKIINGGMNGYQGRYKYYQKALAFLKANIA